jgi:hypothetical protein
MLAIHLVETTNNLLSKMELNSAEARSTVPNKPAHAFSPP